MKEFAYQEIGEIEQGGVVVKRDLMLHIDDDVYKLSVASHDYINSLKDYNEPFVEELKLDENILAIDSVSDLEEVAEEISQMAWEEVEPYLVLQEK